MRSEKELKEIIRMIKNKYLYSKQARYYLIVLNYVLEKRDNLMFDLKDISNE